MVIINGDISNNMKFTWLDQTFQICLSEPENDFSWFFNFKITGFYEYFEENFKFECFETEK